MKHNHFGSLRTVLCVVLLIAAYVLQTSLGLRISVLGAHIDLLSPLLAAAGVVMGSGTGMVCGLAAGILWDISGSGVDGIFPLYYMMCGIGCGFAGERYRTRELRCTMVCAVGMMAVIALLRYLFQLQFYGADILLFARGILLQAALVAVFSPVMLWVVRKLSGRKRRRNAVLRSE
ncbi:MAG: hypothetical protein Q4P20_00795 [Eubacteriales bacterium]|nr:hypothetical protein [Eubacteriales bacterium]